jgi:5-hydroxyisourate hydrolase
MPRLTTHVLDTANGIPAARVPISLYSLRDGRRLVTSVVTNDDGRTAAPLLDDDSFQPGPYELEFTVGAYFAGAGGQAGDVPFLDDIIIRFSLAQDQDYHVPLLVSPWSYSTYRGS